MSLRLGFFSDFKWADSVLLTGSPNDIHALISQLKEFFESDQYILSIHNLAEYIGEKPIQFFATKESSSASLGDAEYIWLCSTSNQKGILAKLASLAEATDGGHQYFDLENTDAELIVSVGEYNY